MAAHAVSQKPHGKGGAGCQPVRGSGERRKNRAGTSDIFQLVKDFDAVLGTAHISPKEAFIVVEEARNAGIKKIVLTHPEWWIVDMSLEDQIRMVKDYDIILERCYAKIWETADIRVIFRITWTW